MSHALKTQHKNNDKVEFLFENKIFKQKIMPPEQDQYNHQEYGRTQNYKKCLRIFQLLEYNIRGLNENINYLLLLCKKGKINMSSDIYENHILPILIHNYNFQFINEFCILKELQSNEDFIYKYKSIYYVKGIDFMIYFYNYLNYYEENTSIKNYNDESYILLEGNNYNEIFEANRDIIKEAFCNGKDIYVNKSSYCNYKIVKTCKKIIKTQGEFGVKKQYKNENIQTLTINLREKKDYLKMPYMHEIYDYLMSFGNTTKGQEEEEKFLHFIENKKSIINVSKLLKYVKHNIKNKNQFTDKINVEPI